MSKRMLRSTPLCIALVLALFLIPGYAQSIQNGKINGKVLMESGEPVPGVAVTVFSDALISGSRTAVSSENGGFLFLELPIGQYRVEASLDGFRKSVASRVNVSAAAVSSVNLILTQGQITEEVTVAADAPVVDVRTSTVDTKIKKELMEKLPTSRDAFYDLSLTAPGLADAGKDATWLPSPTAYGSGANENVFLVNGVNTTNPRGGAFGTMVNVNYNSVEEVRMVALGAKAEYGSSTGVAIDVVTKSGGNRFGGSISFNSQLFAEKNNTPEETDGADYGADYILHAGRNISNYSKTDMVASMGFGGALIKNKVWFYTGLNYMDYQFKKPLFEPLLSTQRPMFDLKLTTEPFKNHHAWVAYHFEKTDVMGDTWGDNVPWEAQVQMGRTETNNTMSAQWQWYPSQTTFVTAKYLGFWTDWISRVPDDASPNPAYINWWKVQQFGAAGHFPYAEGREAIRNTVQADVSQYAENFLGDHDMKFGVQYTNGSSNELNGYFTGKANFAYPVNYITNKDEYIETYGDEGGMLWYVNEVQRDTALTVRKFEQLGLFFDDQWAVNDRLTINLGLRYDKWRNWYGEGKVFEANRLPNDLSLDMPVKATRAGTGDVFNMSSISPRFGLTYSLTKDGKTVIRANYGRYYMPIGMENLSSRGPNLPLQTTISNNYLLPFDMIVTDADGNIDYNKTVANLRGLTPYEEGWRSEDEDLSWTAQVAAGTKPQYTDQLTLNLERELLRDFSVSFTYIYKKSGNMMMNYPINRLTGQPWEFEPYPYEYWYEDANGEWKSENYTLYSIPQIDRDGDGDFDWDDAQWVYKNTTHEVRTMNEWNGKKINRSYNGFQLVFNKNYSNRWQMMASLLYTKSQGVANRLLAQDWNIEGTNIMDGNFVASPNDFINNLDQTLPFTPQWEAKINGSYTIPGVEISLGVRYRFNSGRYYWYLAELPTIKSWSPEGILAFGNTFMRSVDPKKLPNMNILDLQLSRNFNFGERTSLTASLDIFNVFNSAIVTNLIYNPSNGPLGQMTGLTQPFKVSGGLTLEF